MPPVQPTSKVRPIGELDIAWLQWLGAPHPREGKLLALAREGGLNYKGVDGCGPLVWALRQHRQRAEPFLKSLLAAGFDPNEPQSSISPVFEACYQRDMKGLRLLLAHGACPNGQDRTTPLGQASTNESDFRFVEELIKSGASIAPSLRFDGLAVAYGSRMDNFHKFRAGKLWNDLARLVAAHAPGQWGEFASQVREWADHVGEPAFVSQVDRWVSMQEAHLVLETSTPCVARESRSRPRI